MIGSANGRPISITGLGCNVPDRIVTNADLEELVQTSDEWIVTRTGIHERRLAEPGELAMSELALPAAERALEQAGVDPAEIDVLIVATVTPDMAFPSTAAILADKLGMPDAAAYDLSAGCTGFMYAIAQAYGMVASGPLEEGARDWRRRPFLDSRLDRPLDPDPVRGRRGRGRDRAGGIRRLPRLRARGRRRRRRQPLAPRQRLPQVRKPRKVREDERPRSIQVCDAGARLVRTEDPRRVRQDCRGRRRVRPAPGEHPDHRTTRLPSWASRRRR